MSNQSYHTSVFDQIIDAAAKRWPQTDDDGCTLADHAAVIVERRGVRPTRVASWRIDDIYIGADVGLCTCKDDQFVVFDDKFGRVCAHRVAVWTHIKLMRATVDHINAQIAAANGRPVHMRARTTYGTGSFFSERIELLQTRIDGERWTDVGFPAPLAVDDFVALMYDARYCIALGSRVNIGNHHAGQETWTIERMRNVDNPGDVIASTRIKQLYGWDATHAVTQACVSKLRNGLIAAVES